MATNEIVVTQEDGPITDAHADFVRALIAFARHRIAAEQRVYERAREQAARVADAKAKQWRDFASMALPAMPDPAVCRVHANKAEELATAIRSMKDEGR